MDKAEYVFYKLAQGESPALQGLSKLPTSGINDITNNPGNLNKSLLQSGKLSWKQHNLGRNAYMEHDKPINNIDNDGVIDSNQYFKFLKSKGYAPPQPIP